MMLSPTRGLPPAVVVPELRDTCHLLNATHDDAGGLSGTIGYLVATRDVPLVELSRWQRGVRYALTAGVLVTGVAVGNELRDHNVEPGHSLVLDNGPGFTDFSVAPTVDTPGYGTRYTMKHTSIKPPTTQVGRRATVKAGHRLEHRIEEHKAVLADTGHDVLYTVSKDVPRWEFEFRTDAPLVMRIGSKSVYFAIHRDSTAHDVHVSPIPSSAAQVDDSSHLLGINYGDIVPEASSHRVSFNKKGGAVIHDTATDNLKSDIPVGRTVKAPHQALPHDKGKSFASTAMVSNIRRAKSVTEVMHYLQKFDNQFNIAVDPGLMTPNNIALSYDSLEMQRLWDVKDAAVAAITSRARYRLGWIEGAVRIDHFVTSLHNTGIEVPASADWDNRENFFSVPSAEDIFQHEDSHQVWKQLLVSYPDLKEQWIALNAPGFHYMAASGLDCVGPVSICSPDWHPEVGAVNGYATSTPEEDWAMIVQFLFTPGFYQKMLKTAETDEFLAAKIAFAKGLIAEIDSRMSGQYWVDINRTNFSPKLTTPPSRLNPAVTAGGVATSNNKQLLARRKN